MKTLKVLAIIVLVLGIAWFALGQPTSFPDVPDIQIPDLPVQISLNNADPTPTPEFLLEGDGQGGFYDADAEAIPQVELNSTPVPIIWDEDLKTAGWVQSIGLSKAQILYRQSSTAGNETIEIDLDRYEDQVLLVGALNATLKVDDGPSFTGTGVYTLVETGRVKVTYSDGFLAIVPQNSVEAELCARVIQARAENWLVQWVGVMENDGFTGQNFDCNNINDGQVPVDQFRDPDLLPENLEPTPTG